MTDAPIATTSPIFLLGAQRSGTTMLGLMLRGHPELAWLGEFEYAVDSFEAGWPEASVLRDRLATDRRFRAQAFVLDPSLPSAELVDSFLEQARERQGRPLVGATFHRHFDRVVELWPQARIVYLVRDGRDVALSRVGRGWAGNVFSACSVWRETEEQWARVRETLPPRQWLEIRFEDLIASAEPTLERICAFIDIAYSAEMLGYPSRSNYARPDPSLTEQWRHRLSARELGLLEHAIGPMLRARGYPGADVEPLRPTAARRTWLRLQNRLYRWRFRLRRFGISLLVGHFLARRLGLRGLERRLKLRMDAITTEQLK